MTDRAGPDRWDSDRRGHSDLVAVITGASRGLGAGIAEAWALRGLRLGLCARTRPDPPARVVVPAEDDSARVETASVDVTEDGAVEEFARVVVERFGRIDLWVNNAGVLDPIGPLVDVGPRALREHFDVNVMGVAAGSAAFARHVRARPGTGVLVNMSSGAATKPYEGWGPYCGSKAAVEIMTEVIAREERVHGLWAYALSPGVVDTDMQALIRSTPPDRFPQVDRFLRLHADRSFNAPAWVGAYILDRLAADVGPDAPVGEVDPSAVRLRVPDEP